MAYPKISIITPSYNQGKFINQTIDSVLNQNYPNLEFIVVDGGSTDNTVEILKSYGSKIQWVSEKDHGQADAINKGLRMATGEILAYLNSDDCYLPGALNHVAQKFADPRCSWLVGDYEIVDEHGKPIQKFVVLYKKLLRMVSSRWLLLIANFIPQPSTFWKAELLTEGSLFNIGLRYTLDYDIWLRFWKISRPVITSMKLSSFRIHGESKGGKEFQRQFDEELKVLSSYSDSRWIYRFHSLHNFLITLIYKLIK